MDGLTLPSVESVIMIGFLASLLAGLATGLGALPAVFIGRISARTEDVMLGFAAGVMLAASFFSLILPALDAARAGEPNESVVALKVIAGILLGAVCVWLMHHYAPHEHFIMGPDGVPSKGLRRVWLFVIAITLHNFPEGLAVGVGFGGGDIERGTSLAIGIGLQNIPEGLAVVAALLTENYSKPRALGIALLTGLVEPVGGLLGVTVVSLAEPLLPWGLAFAAGAMLFIISHEIIPETHRKGYKTIATFSLMIGFALMMFLDVSFG